MEELNIDPPQVEINISNVNSKGQIVLNDQKLLELIVLYPFLFNPRVCPYRDPDYDNWAWQGITTAFNESYKRFELKTEFTTSQLKIRWEELKPITATLMRAVGPIPRSLHNVIVEINNGRKTSTELNSRPQTNVESLILDNISMVENLPLRERKLLESEVMELLLNTELEAHSTLKLGSTELDLIEKDYNDFIETITLKNLVALDLDKSGNTKLSSDFLTELNMDRNSNSSSIQINDDILMNDLQQSDENIMEYRLDTDITNKFALHGSGQLDYEEVDTNPPDQLLADVKPSLLTTVRTQSTDQSCDSWSGHDESPQEISIFNDNSSSNEQLPTQQQTPIIRVIKEAAINGTHITNDDVNPSTTELTTHEQTKKSSKRNLGTSCIVTLRNIQIGSNQQSQKVNTGRNLIVPLKSASYYIRNVRVRVKRINLDDYVPLSKFRNTRCLRRR